MTRGMVAACVSRNEPSRSGFALARLAQHPADGLGDQLVRIAGERLGEPKRVVELAPPDERVGTENRCPPLHRPRRLRQAVEDVPRLVDEVFAHDVDRAPVDEIPGIDAIVPADVEIEQLAPPL